MCYLEDVYHVPCGHWADKPRIWHPCSKTPSKPDSRLTPAQTFAVDTRSGRDNLQSRTSSMRIMSSCHNSQTTRSSRDKENKCPKCRIDVEKIVSQQSGMWFSVSRNPVTGKMVFKDRKPESTTSKRARLGRGMKVTPRQIRRERSEAGGEDEDTPSRNSSWSSHGHVTL